MPIDIAQRDRRLIGEEVDDVALLLGGERSGGEIHVEDAEEAVSRGDRGAVVGGEPPLDKGRGGAGGALRPRVRHQERAALGGHHVGQPLAERNQRRAPLEISAVTRQAIAAGGGIDEADGAARIGAERLHGHA